jgi:hypothetical protein
VQWRSCHPGSNDRDPSQRAAGIPLSGNDSAEAALMSSFTEPEIELFASALIKCHLLQEIIGDKKFKICVLAKDDIPKAVQAGLITMILRFSFKEVSDNQVSDILQKLDYEGKLAWLKERS